MRNSHSNTKQNVCDFEISVLAVNSPLPDCSSDALSPSPTAAFLADMAGAGTPGPRTPMHVDEAV